MKWYAQNLCSSGEISENPLGNEKTVLANKIAVVSMLDYILVGKVTRSASKMKIHSLT